MWSDKTMTAFHGAGSGQRALWIRTAAGPDIGFGHLRRCIVLAGLLSDCTLSLFLLDPENCHGRDLIVAAGCEYVVLNIEEAWNLLPDPVAVLVDTRLEKGLDLLITTAREKSIPVISIHDLGLNPLPSDIAIDGSVAPGPAGASRASFKGPEYMVLDPVYAELHDKGKQIGNTVRKIFINLGGGDSRKFFPVIMEGLRLCKRDFDVTGVRGFTSWGQESFETRDWGALHFRWESQTPETALWAADLAITAGGLSGYEALCTGTPLLVLSYDDYQQMTARAFSRKGACIDLGLGEHLTPDRLAAQLALIDGNEELRRRISRQGKEIVDGRGAERVAQLIQTAMLKPKLQCAGARS
jgi:spore coat polysaccharide biosynthesis predicted glycosyltransferase SpsG